MEKHFAQSVLGQRAKSRVLRGARPPESCWCGGDLHFYEGRSTQAALPVYGVSPHVRAQGFTDPAVQRNTVGLSPQLCRPQGRWRGAKHPRPVLNGAELDALVTTDVLGTAGQARPHRFSTWPTRSREVGAHVLFCRLSNTVIIFKLALAIEVKVLQCHFRSCSSYFV